MRVSLHSSLTREQTQLQQPRLHPQVISASPEQTWSHLGLSVLRWQQWGRSWANTTRDPALLERIAQRRVKHQIQTRLIRASVNQILEIFQREILQALPLAPLFNIHHRKMFFQTSKSNHPCFTLYPLLSCPLTVQSWKNSGSDFSAIFSQALEGCSWYSKPSHVQSDQFSSASLSSEAPCCGMWWVTPIPYAELSTDTWQPGLFPATAAMPPSPSSSRDSSQPRTCDR